MEMYLRPRSMKQGKQGIALVLVLSILVIISSLVAISALLAINNRSGNVNTELAVQAQNAAEAGIEQAVDQVFYEAQRRWILSREGGVGVKFDACALKKWLTGYWSNSTAFNDEILVEKNNTGTCLYLGSTRPDLPNNLALALSERPINPNLLNNATVQLDSNPVTTNVIDDWKIGDSKVKLSVTRTDDLLNDEISLTIRSIADIENSNGKQLANKSVERTLKISGNPSNDDEFALLTNDINCSFCHLQVDNMTRAYADINSTNKFKRVKIGTLNGVNFNGLGHNNDTLIAGTIYSRGDAKPNAGTDVYFAQWADSANPGLLKAGTNSSIGAGSNTRKYTAVEADGAYNPAAAPEEVKAIDAIKPPYAKTKFGKIYYNYPRPSTVGNAPWNTEWPDGAVPEKFITVIPETVDDGLITDSEWANYIASAPSGKLEIESGSTGVTYGIRRPRSAVSNTDPISYDPVRQTNGFVGTRLGDGSNSINTWNADINALNNTINTWAAGNAATRAAGRAALQTALNTFGAAWRGWIVQQAISSPNNRDLRPTHTGADLNTATVFIPIPQIPANWNGAALNNYWVSYNPTLSTLSLSFCAFDPCAIRRNLNGTVPANKATNPTGDTSRRNINILAAADAAQLEDLITINVTLADQDLFPTTSNGALAALSSNGYYDGNLIIDGGRIGTVGTPGRSIKLTGTIKINGDLVIRGQFYGEGRFVVRGNIYFIGDVVYHCKDSNGACKRNDGEKPSYRNSKKLPKLAFLAGGSVIVGDYDFPDFRANRSQLNLINDQHGQARSITNWNYQLVPGSTGTNMNLNSENRDSPSKGNMGFAPMMASFANYRAEQGVVNRYFLSAPFGFGVSRTNNVKDANGNLIGGFGAYESGNATAINSYGGKAIQTLYPSNGSILIGNSNGTNNGFVSRNSIANNLTCVNALNATNPAIRFPMPTMASAALQTVTFGFWCPRQQGNFVRNWNVDANNPATSAVGWTNQPTVNAGLDGIGMTTGWLGGLLNTGATGAGFDALGDLSQTRLLKLMWLTTMENSNADRNPDTSGNQVQGPLRTDGLLYSRNSLFALARFYLDQANADVTASNSTGINNRNGADSRQANTQARWIHHGSLLSYELGFLLTGNVEQSRSRFTVNRSTPIDFSPATSSGTEGPAMAVLWDERLTGILGLGANSALNVRRSGVFTQVPK